MIYALVDIDETMVSVPHGINAKTSAVMFKKVFGINAHEEMIDNVGKTELGIIQEVLAKFGLGDREISEETYKVWAEAMDAELKNDPVKILPGMTEFLEALSKNPNVKLFLLTGNSPWRAESKLKSAFFDKYFRDLVTGRLAGVFGNATPKRDGLFTILKNSSDPGDKFVVVDDSLIGARMVKDNNLTMIAVATGKATDDQLAVYTKNVFPDLGEDRWKEAVSIISG
jgi:phosphoglycolate phosphatase-like HAD superfamily hydrolase